MLITSTFSHSRPEADHCALRASHAAAKDGEAGYFAGRMHGQIQYLMWWVDGWYPAHENRAPRYVRLRQPSCVQLHWYTPSGWAVRI
jgi:hypothetical protein